MRKLITKERLEQRKRGTLKKTLHPQESSITITTEPKYRLKSVEVDSTAFDSEANAINISIRLLPTLDFIEMVLEIDKKGR